MSKQSVRGKGTTLHSRVNLDRAGHCAEELERSMGFKWSSEFDVVLVINAHLMRLQRIHLHVLGVASDGSEAPMVADVTIVGLQVLGIASDGSEVPMVADETVVDDLLVTIMRLSILAADSGRRIMPVPRADRQNYDVVYRRLVELKALDVPVLKGSRLGRSPQFQLRVLHELLGRCLIDSDMFRSWIESHRSFINA